MRVVTSQSGLILDTDEMIVRPAPPMRDYPTPRRSRYYHLLALESTVRSLEFPIEDISYDAVLSQLADLIGTADVIPSPSTADWELFCSLPFLSRETEHLIFGVAYVEIHGLAADAERL